MSQLIFVRGIQGSGKTTWSREWVSQDPENRIRISWDDLRRMYGPYWIQEREPFVKSTSLQLASLAMQAQKDIVIDNMNLSENGIADFRQLALDNNYEVVYQDIKTPVEECIARDAVRFGDEQIGASIIMATYNRHKDFYESEENNSN